MFPALGASSEGFFVGFIRAHLASYEVSVTGTPGILASDPSVAGHGSCPSAMGAIFPHSGKRAAAELQATIQFPACRSIDGRYECF